MLASLWISDLPPEELGEQSHKIESVTLEDVEKASRKYFPVSRMTVVAVGEENVVREQLAPFGLEFKKVEEAPPGGSSATGRIANSDSPDKFFAFFALLEAAGCGRYVGLPVDWLSATWSENADALLCHGVRCGWPQSAPIICNGQNLTSGTSHGSFDLPEICQHSASAVFGI